MLPKSKFICWINSSKQLVIAIALLCLVAVWARSYWVAEELAWRRYGRLTLNNRAQMRADFNWFFYRRLG